MIEEQDSEQKIHSHSVDSNWLDQIEQSLTNESVQQLKPELIGDNPDEQVISGLEHLVFYEDGKIHPIKTDMILTPCATIIGLIIRLICFCNK